MDKATLEAAARVCKKTADLYEDNRTEAFCNGAYSIAIRLYNEILSLADQAPVAPVETTQVYLVDGKQYTACDCPKQDSKCRLGLIARTLSTTEFSRCLLPVAAPPVEAKKGT